MEQAHRIDLLDIMSRIYQKPQSLDEHWDTVSPLLAELSDTAPEGLEGMASMICTHLNNAVKFNDEKVKKFELESGLIKLQSYLQKLNTFKQE